MSVKGILAAANCHVGAEFRLGIGAYPGAKSRTNDGVPGAGISRQGNSSVMVDGLQRLIGNG